MTVAMTLPTLGHRCNPSLYPPDFTSLYALLFVPLPASVMQRHAGLYHTHARPANCTAQLTLLPHPFPGLIRHLRFAVRQAMRQRP